MSRREINLIGGFYKDSSLPWSAQDTVNWLPVPAQEGGTRSPMKLRGAPGLRAAGFQVQVCAQVPGSSQRDTFEATHADATIRTTTSGVYATSGPVGESTGQPIQFLDLSNTLGTVANRGYTGGSVPAPGSSFELYGGNGNRLVFSEDGISGLAGLLGAGEWRAYLFPNNTVADSWFFSATQNRSDCVWWSNTHVYLCFTVSSNTPSTNDASYRIYRWPLTATGARVLPDASTARLNTGVSAPNMRFHRSRDGNIHAYSVEDNLWRVFNAGLTQIDSFTPPVSIGRPIGVDGAYYFIGGTSTVVGGQAALFVRRRSDWSLVSEIQLPYLTGASFQGSVNWSITFNSEVIVVQSRNRAVTIPYPLVCEIE
jgi:hypothetical protein